MFGNFTGASDKDDAIENEKGMTFEFVVCGENADSNGFFGIYDEVFEPRRYDLI